MNAAELKARFTGYVFDEIELDVETESLVGFATVLLRAQKADEASAMLERAERSLRDRIRPPRVQARIEVLRARILIEVNRKTQAAQLLRETTERPGAPAEAWFYLAEALTASSAPEARTAYERYLELAPTGPLASRARRAIN